MDQANFETVQNLALAFVTWGWIRPLRSVLVDDAPPVPLSTILKGSP